ncbi:hypothetical protein AB8Z38_34955 [Bradyrhizobium sp. LLZ17]|uniref:Uncharacterized protein n=1 Tax=Bradyrhizobium sp. LLZ17 TaxID=3239388 RepID=A0AB39XKD7_9BRAD
MAERTDRETAGREQLPGFPGTHTINVSYDFEDTTLPQAAVADGECGLPLRHILVPFRTRNQLTG